MGPRPGSGARREPSSAVTGETGRVQVVRLATRRSGCVRRSRTWPSVQRWRACPLSLRCSCAVTMQAVADADLRSARAALCAKAHASAQALLKCPHPSQVVSSLP